MPKQFSWLQVFQVYDSVHGQLKLIAIEHQEPLTYLIDQIFREWLDREEEKENERENLDSSSSV